MRTVEEMNLEHRKVEALESIANSLQALIRVQTKLYEGQDLNSKRLTETLRGMRQFTW